MTLALKIGTLKILTSPRRSSSFDGPGRDGRILGHAVTETCPTNTVTGPEDTTKTGETGTECGVTHNAECTTATNHGTCAECTGVPCPTIGPDGDPEC
jgi:hypothetical protein